MEQELWNLMDLCRYESNVDRQVQILHQIDEQLPEVLHIKFPSLITNEYVIRALDWIEDKTRYHKEGQCLSQLNLIRQIHAR